MQKDPPNAAGDLSAAKTTPTSPAAPHAHEGLFAAAEIPPTSPSGEKPKGTGTFPSTQLNPPESRFSRWVHRSSYAIPIVILGAFAIVLLKLAIILFHLMYPLSYPTQMYLSLSAGAAILILAGLFFLIILIPAASKFLKSELRTELYSVLASSLCVIAGLIMLGIVAIGLVSTQLIQALRRP